MNRIKALDDDYYWVHPLAIVCAVLAASVLVLSVRLIDARHELGACRRAGFSVESGAAVLSLDARLEEHRQ